MIWGKFLGQKMVGTSSSLHVRSFASLDPAQKTLFVYLMNLSDQSKHIRPAIEGYQIKEIRESWELVGKNADDTNPVWREVTKFPKKNVQVVPGTSIRVIKYALR
jgi:hypothetical protein